MKSMLLGLAVIVGAGLAWWWSGDEPLASEPEAQHTRGPEPAPGSPAGEPPASDEIEIPSVPSIDPDRRRFAQPDGPGAPGSMREVIDYPLVAKLTREPLSAIPHRVVGAWDDAPDATELGSRRAFIAVVSPELSDEELADFARDVRDRHRDADWLTVRVFDSESAATRPSWTDGGAARDAHLVAELRRNTAGQGEWLTVRGQDVDP